jgi:hypothetical protein
VPLDGRSEHEAAEVVFIFVQPVPIVMDFKLVHPVSAEDPIQYKLFPKVREANFEQLKNAPLLTLDALEVISTIDAQP